MPLFDGRFYEVVRNGRTQTHDVVWVRQSKDKPKVSLWSIEGDREHRQAKFKEERFAREYARLVGAGDFSRFTLHDD